MALFLPVPGRPICIAGCTLLIKPDFNLYCLTKAVCRACRAAPKTDCRRKSLTTHGRPTATTAGTYVKITIWVHSHSRLEQLQSQATIKGCNERRTYMFQEASRTIVGSSDRLGAKQALSRARVSALAVKVRYLGLSFLKALPTRSGSHATCGQRVCINEVRVHYAQGHKRHGAWPTSARLIGNVTSR